MGSSTTEQLSSRQFCSECGKPYAPEDLARFGEVVVCVECKPNYVQRMREGVTTSNSWAYGGFWRRALALWIDSILVAIMAFPLRMIMAAPLATGIGSYRYGAGYAFWTAFWGSFWSLGTAITYLLEFIYNVYFVSQKGATLGKMVMGMKIVTATGGPISVGRAVGRYFARNLSWMILFIGYIMAAFDDQKRALHDHICNTRVIRD